MNGNLALLHVKCVECEDQKGGSTRNLWKQVVTSLSVYCIFYFVSCIFYLLVCILYLLSCFLYLVSCDTKRINGIRCQQLSVASCQMCQLWGSERKLDKQFMKAGGNFSLRLYLVSCILYLVPCMLYLLSCTLFLVSCDTKFSCVNCEHLELWAAYCWLHGIEGIFCSNWNWNMLKGNASAGQIYDSRCR